MATADIVKSRKKQWASERFWNKFEPELHVGDVAFMQTLPIFGVDEPNKEVLRALIRTEGYFQLPPPDWQLPIDRMAALAVKLVENDIPTPFAFVYDEFWALAVKLHQVVESVLGPGFLRLPDFWLWHVDPTRDERGWRPHRDKGHWSLRPDGSTKALTLWLALSESNTLNGCMYILPADRDPVYGTVNDKDWQIDYPEIRALPAAAGSVFGWTQAVLHWGSHGSPREVRPRISAAFEFQARDVEPFNQPLMEPLTIPDFDMRLKLIAKQILQYQHMYPLSEEVKAIAEGIVAS